MSDNKTMIRFYVVLLLVAALLTYAVDLNSQFYFVRLDSALISNSFCFAILSGVLTGVIVALAAEIRLYFLHRRQARETLYALASELYALLSVQRASLRYYINNQHVSIPDNIGRDYAQQPILVRISHFKSIDYSTFSKKDEVLLALRSLKTQVHMIESTVRNLVNCKLHITKLRFYFLKNTII